MKRFDISVRVLNDEIFRIVGKVAVDAVEKKHNPGYSYKATKAQHLREAIKILTEHHRNKFV